MRLRARVRWLHLAVFISGAAAVWAAFITVFGGFTVRIGTHVVSSNNPVNPLILATVISVAAFLAATAEERRLFRAWIESRSLLLRYLPPLIAASAATMVTSVGLAKGAHFVGGADAYGYVSQAELWARGAVSYREPLVEELNWTFAPSALAPLGYFPTRDGTIMAPAYAPGFPMVLALFHRAGGRPAVFYAVPLLAGLAVWATYLMGARLAGRAVGLAASVLLATSPSFVMQTLTMPMSDVPAAAWWALSLSATLVDRRGAALGAGLAAGAAILTRPNLAPLALIAALPILIRALGNRQWWGRGAQQVACFAAGAAPGALVMAALNTHWYGSPFVFGQLLANPPLRWQYVSVNAPRYLSWLIETQTGVVGIAVAAPFALAARMAGRGASPATSARTAAVWLCFIAAVFASYFVFIPVDGWSWLRYLLPAFPPLFVLTAAALSAGLARFGQHVRVIGMAVIIGALAARAVDFSRGADLLSVRTGEMKYRRVGDYIASHFPERAIFVSVLYSGTIRHYAAKPIVRYDVMPPEWLERAMADLVRRGYHPYLVIDRSEDEVWKQRFSGHARVGALDWPPEVLLDQPAQSRVFDLLKPGALK